MKTSTCVSCIYDSVLYLKVFSPIRHCFQGLADPLNSAFHLTYNMVLNLLRVEEVNPEIMLEKSFYQFQKYAAIPTMVDSTSLTQLVFILEKYYEIALRFTRNKTSKNFKILNTRHCTSLWRFHQIKIGFFCSVVYIILNLCVLSFNLSCLVIAVKFLKLDQCVFSVSVWPHYQM